MRGRRCEGPSPDTHADHDLPAAMPVCVWLQGACPARVPERCRAVLFSGMKGCSDLAGLVFQGNGR